MNKTEYYYCDESGTVRGPKTESGMKALRASGMLTDATMVCCGGSKDWKTYAEQFAAAPEKERQPEQPQAHPTPRRSWLAACPLPKAAHVQTALLLLVSVLLVVNLFRTQPVVVSVPDTPAKEPERIPIPVSVMPGDAYEYEYGVIHLSREDMQVSHEVAVEKNRLVGGVTNIDHRLGTIHGWEYVGIICNDGINASWILVRRPRPKQN